MNLLIVDDEIISIKGMMEGIDWEGCGVDGSIWTAYSAERAIRILNMQQVDLMLCDIEMPGASGLELLRAIRKTDKELACIFLTCHASFTYAQEAISLGCVDYILKPAPYELIAEKVRETCAELQRKKRAMVQEKYFGGPQDRPDSEGRKTGKSPKELVLQVEEYIRGHLRENELMVSDIADSIYLNKDYLNRVFKKERGISISQYLIQERMKLAAALLADEKNNVNMVAEQVGYQNYPYFASSFKRYYHCTPSQYQKDHAH
ncbi:MAG: response regulator [Blautia sp.]|nr:response regulator [Blautia sp.]MCM1202428.1 response regulator [Bacteroides fragilis]